MIKVTLTAATLLALASPTIAATTVIDFDGGSNGSAIVITHPLAKRALA